MSRPRVYTDEERAERKRAVNRRTVRSNKAPLPHGGDWEHAVNEHRPTSADPKSYSTKFWDRNIRDVIREYTGTRCPASE